MKKGILKKTLITTLSVFVLLVMVLIAHIYLVTRPKAPDENTIVMARIDIKEPVTEADAQKITNWMYLQKGIDHVMCSAAMRNIVFTYRPLHGNANEIAADFKSAFHYANSIRYVPSEKELQSGCPVASTSYSYKVYNYFRHLL